MAKKKFTKKSKVVFPDNYSKVSYVMFARTNTPNKHVAFPLSLKDYQGMVNLEKNRFEVLGVTNKDICSVINFPQQHIIPSAQGIMNIGATYIPIEGTTEEICEKLIKYKVSVIHTTYTTVEKILAYSKTINKNFSLKIINTSAQKIPNLEEAITQVEEELGAKLIDMIGSAELQNYALFCQNCMQYHFLDKYQEVEIVDIKGKKSKKGQIVITPKWRKDFIYPYYLTEDVVSINHQQKFEKCIIKNKKTFKEIEKRVDDSFKLNGNIAHFSELKKVVSTLLHNQYFFDKFLWNFCKKIDFDILYDERKSRDLVIIKIINKKYFRFSLRKIKPISQFFNENYYVKVKLEL